MNHSKSFDPETQHYWESGWEEHEQMQLLRLARLPLEDKLSWLEVAHKLVLHMAAAKSRIPNPLA